MSRTERDLREPVDGQGALFPASTVPRRRSAPPPDVPAPRRPRRAVTAHGDHQPSQWNNGSVHGRP